MKKIAVIVKNTTFNKSFGGLEVHTKNLVDLLSQNFEVDVFAPKRELNNESITESNKTYYFVDSNYKTGLFSDLSKKNWNYGIYTFFKKKYEENRYNLIISISSAGYPILRKKSEFKCQFLTISHGTALAEYKSLFNEGGFSLGLIKNTPYFLYNYFYKQPNFIKNSDFVVCVSDYVRNSLIKETNSKFKEKFKTIFNGVEISNFSKEFNSEGKLKAIFAGRVERSKGIFILLDAIKNLEVELLVAGDGVSLQDAKNFTLENKLNSKVNFLGRLTSEELKKCYQQCDLLIVPSLRVEGFPMSILEGMSNFLPVIATNIGGNADAVVNSKTGFLIDPGNPHLLETKLEYFNTYPEKIKEFGINGHNLVMQRFSIKGMIEEYLKVINKLIN